MLENIKIDGKKRVENTPTVGNLDAIIEASNKVTAEVNTTDVPLSKRTLQELIAMNICPYCLKSHLDSDDELPNVRLKNKAEYHAHCYNTMISSIKRYRKLGYTVTLILPTE